MYEKICPILKAAGYVGNKEECDPCCAWYVAADDNEGCALAVIAAEMAKESEN